MPLVTSKCLFGWNVGKLAPGIDVFHLDFSGQDLFRRISSQEQHCGVRETCLTVGLLPLIIHCDHYSDAFKHVPRSSVVREFCVRSVVIDLSQTNSSNVGGFNFA